MGWFLLACGVAPVPRIDEPATGGAVTADSGVPVESEPPVDSEPPPDSAESGDTPDTSDTSACVTGVYHRDADGDGYGDPNVEIEACEAPDGHVNNADDCNDSSALAYPGGTPACDGVDNDCDGSLEDCRRWTGEYDATDADATLVNVAGEWLAACDIDGDGALDLLTGHDEDSGVAYAFGELAAGASLADTDARLTLSGIDSAEALAARGACLRDVTGDGLDDLLLDRADGAVLLEAPLSGNIDSSWAFATFDQGHAWAALDHDGDGDLDLATGAHDDDTSGNQEGAVRIFEGPVVAGASALATRTGDTRAYLGVTLVNLGDIDGDGNDDLAAGATGYDDGVVLGWLGPLAGETSGLDSADLRVEDTDAGGLGAALDTAGDLDGDGNDDLVVAGDRAVLAFSGPATLGSLGPGDAFARVEGLYFQGLATADSDGDTVGDLWIGAPTESRLSTAYLYYGPLGGTLDTSAVSASFLSYGYYDHFGTALVSLGDIDGSGTDDVAVANPAQSGSRDVYVFLGGAL